MLRKRICLMVLIIILALPVYTQAALQDEWDSVHSIPGSDELYLVCRNHLWGVANRAGEVIIAPRFVSAPRFEGEYAVFSEENPLDIEEFSGVYEYGLLFGLLNSEGEIVIDAEYEYIDIIGDADVVIVQKDLGYVQRYALMNHRGENLTGFIFTYASELFGGFIKVAVPDESTGMGQRLWGVYGPDGREVLPIEYIRIDEIHGKPENRISVQRTEGGAHERYELKDGHAVPLDVFATPSPSDRLLDSWERITRIQSGAGNYLVYRSGKWGMVNADNEIIIRPAFCYEPEFTGGYAVVSIESGVPAEGFSGETAYNTLDGLINDAGETILPVEYEDISLSNDGSIAMLKAGDQYGYLNLATDLLIEPQYYTASMFVGERAAAAIKVDLGDESRDSMSETSCWGVIDREGREIIPFDYDMIEIGKNGVAQVTLNGMKGYIDADGKPITGLKYDYANPFAINYAAVGIRVDVPGTSGDPVKDAESAWGAIDMQGNEVIPCKYDQLQLCENGLALVSLDGLHGFINMQDETIVDLKYDHARVFTDDYAAVGRDVPLPEGDAISDSIETTILWGLIDAEGNEILPMDYDSVGVLDDGSLIAAVNDVQFRFEIQNGRATEIPAE